MPPFSSGSARCAIKVACASWSWKTKPSLRGSWPRRWRDAGISVPVLVLTARGSWHEKVQGIDSGADDYVAKPFRMEELLARLRALMV